MQMLDKKEEKKTQKKPASLEAAFNLFTYLHLFASVATASSHILGNWSHKAQAATSYTLRTCLTF